MLKVSNSANVFAALDGFRWRCFLKHPRRASVNVVRSRQSDKGTHRLAVNQSGCPGEPVKRVRDHWRNEITGVFPPGKSVRHLAFLFHRFGILSLKRQ